MPRTRKRCKNCIQLGKEIQEKEQLIKELQTQNELLAYDLKEMRQKWFSHKKNQPDASTETREPKKRGAPVGHKGWFRKKPVKIDEIQDVFLERCPECGSADLGPCDEIDEHTQEDIVLPELKATLYRHHGCWCKRCKKVVYGLGKDEIPHSYIGPNAKSLSSFLKYVVKVSQRDIKKIFQQLCGLTIVPSSIPGFHNQIRKKAVPLYEKLKRKIKKARCVQADETGSPMDGKNRWDWVFATVNICLHVIRESRGQKVVEEILGKKYNGILVSDFLSAYNKVDAIAKQRCLVHLLRDLKKALECSEPNSSVYIYCLRLKVLLQDAIELSKKYARKQITKKDFVARTARLKQALKDFQFPDPRENILRRLSKRLVRHKDELFTFLDYPDIPFHNNHVESLIRAGVLLRKITFGHRSENGVENYNVLMSLQQTARLNNKDPIKLFKQILTCHNNPLMSWCLGKSP